jgi:hypothetical protein
VKLVHGISIREGFMLSVLLFMLRPYRKTESGILEPECNHFKRLLDFSDAYSSRVEPPCIQSPTWRFAPPHAIKRVTQAQSVVRKFCIFD